jgi:hypothetical protein
MKKGVKGGLKEIGAGAAGIITNPLQGAKEGGAKGFFKGMGKGLLGAVTAPVTGVLKVT